MSNVLNDPMMRDAAEYLRAVDRADWLGLMTGRHILSLPMLAHDSALQLMALESAIARRPDWIN